jgi:periplasmic protein TonB
VNRSSLLIAFLTAVLLHLVGLTAAALLWVLREGAAPSFHLIPAELVVATPTSQQEALFEPEQIAPPVPESSPIPPTVQDPIAPPKMAEQAPEVLPQKRPAPKPLPRAEPTRRARRDQGPPHPPPRSHAASKAEPKPGPHVPMPEEDSVGAGGNVSGPSPTKPEEIGRSAIEGGEAGAGNLFNKGDAAVVPGAGAGGGSGGTGRAGLGWGAGGDGTKLGGMRPGSGGEGSGEGVSGSTGPRGGYQVKPRYPDAARRQGAEGTVLLKARVTEHGRVDEVQIETSAGHPALDQAAVEALHRWRFEPARRGRDAIAVWVTIPFQFKLR